MASSTDPNTNVMPDGDAREGQHVDKIRDILFGSQMRDYDKRFSRLEEKLTKNADSLREEMKKRLDALEAFIRQEVESIGLRAKNEKSERAEAVKEITRELRDTSKAIEKKIAQADDQFSKDTTELRTKILEQSKALLGEIQDRHKTMSATLDREVEALQTDKTDRKALADLFTEMAMRLKKEFDLPQGK